MRKVIRFFVLTAVLTALMAAFASGGFADDKDKAVALVKKAVAYYKANGMEKALDEFNNPSGQFVDGEFYVFGYDLKGNMLVNPVNPTLLGQNVMNVPDVDGKLFRKEIIEAAVAKGSGWVDYKIKNPRTKVVEAKTSYFEKVDDLVLGCGIYKK